MLYTGKRERDDGRRGVGSALAILCHPTAGRLTMNRIERRLLRDVINKVAHSDRERWENLKCEIDDGPAFRQFPGYPSAFEMWNEVTSEIKTLPQEIREELIARWTEFHPNLPL